MATKKELLELSQQACGKFFNLVKFLFGEDAPYLINELPEDSPYYKDARDIATEMGLKWDSMSREENARVMLNLIGDYFCNIDVDEDYKPLLTISFPKSI